LSKVFFSFYKFSNCSD